MLNLHVAPGMSAPLDLAQVITYYQGKVNISIGHDVEVYRQLDEIRRVIDDFDAAQLDERDQPKSLKAMKAVLKDVDERLLSMEDTILSGGAASSLSVADVEAEIAKQVAEQTKTIDDELAQSKVRADAMSALLLTTQDQLSQTVDMVRQLQEQVATLQRPVIQYDAQF